MVDLEIQKAFLDGIEEIFYTMFTDKVELSLLDEEATHTNVYEETSDKVYKDPIPLVGKITTTFEQGENPVESVQIDALITIPTKQLITNKIGHDSPEEIESLKKAKLSYRGFEYLVEKVVPKVLVADLWQMYDFYCRVDKKTTRGGK